MHEHVAQVVEVAAGRKVVEHLMADRLACLHQPSQEGGAVALTQPPENADRVLDVDESFEQRPELRVYRAVVAGKEVFHPLLENTSAALTVRVLPPSLPASVAEVAEVSS